MSFKAAILKYQQVVVINDNLLPCASVWSSHRETSNRRWIFLPFHCGWWSLHPESTHDLADVALQQHAGQQVTHTKEPKSYLAHELRDHPVESWSLVTKTLFSCAQSSEVLWKEESQCITLIVKFTFKLLMCVTVTALVTCLLQLI